MLINDKLFMKDNSGFPHCFTISLQNEFFSTIAFTECCKQPRRKLFYLRKQLSL